MSHHSRTIQVDYLARVEGEGAMSVDIVDGVVKDVQLKIFEPPRFFEALLRGRDYTEAPDITARICGICPVAYQMSAVSALEDALGLAVSEEVRLLRRMLYCGEWIESHTLHVYMLHAPDFLGYAGAVEMAADHKEIVERGLRIKKAGNAIVACIGGREVHPINVKVGGFYRAPTRRELEALLPEIDWAIEASEETLRWVSTFHYPDFDKTYEYVALRHDEDYAMERGRLVSSAGLDIAAQAFEQHVDEIHVAHTNALHAVLKGRGAYMVGPMARYNLNFDRLPAPLQQLARDVGLEHPCTNPFRSIAIRSLEILFAFREAKAIIENYVEPETAEAPRITEPVTGYGCTEAPRGTLYHRYTIAPDGLITDANIVPPTSQNQKTIEDDLFQFVTKHVGLDDKELTWRCEQAIRNYDPCISCATHFLDMRIQRR